MSNLFSEAISAFKDVAGGVPEPVQETPQEPAEEPLIDAGIEALKIIKAKGRERGDELRAEIHAKQEELIHEKEAVRKAESYDLIEESKKPGFTKEQAIKVRSELEISQALADQLEDDLEVLRGKLSKVDAETQRQCTSVENHVNDARAVKLWMINGHFNGGLNMQIDRIQRGMRRFDHLRNVVVKLTGDEELADRCVEQVSAISCPSDIISLATEYTNKLPEAFKTGEQ